ARVLDHALLDQRLGSHLVSGVEAVEVAQVDRLGGRAERADRHRVLRRRAAQLADPHVDVRLAALESRPHLVRARTRLPALAATPGIAALAGAQAAPDALAILARLRRRQVGQVQLLLGHQAFSILTRWRTLRSMPASAGDSSCSALRPMRPSPSARRVPRWRPDCPIWDRTCVMRSFDTYDASFLRRSERRFGFSAAAGSTAGSGATAP